MGAKIDIFLFLHPQILTTNLNNKKWLLKLNQKFAPLVALAKMNVP
jgi:hypothetical protein